MDYVSYLQLPELVGLKKGDVVYIASNLVRLAMITRKHEGEFEADKFINALQEAVGEEGTLLFPAFNFSVGKKAKWDIENTVPQTGLLPEAVFKRKDFKRTKHPLHSFLVWGKHTDEICSLNDISSFGENSPFGFLHRNDGRLLGIDVDLQHSLAQAHYVEEKEQVDYRKWRNYYINYVDDNTVKTMQHCRLFGKKIGWVNDVNPLWKDFIEEGVSKEIRLNNVSFRLTNLVKAYPIMARDIHTNEAKKIARFSWDTYVKQVVKRLLGKPIV